MCNLYRMETAPAAIVALAREFGRTVLFPQGAPNIEPRDVRITELAPILRASRTGDAGFDLVQRRWSWPGPNGKPVFNFRTEGRRFAPAERCVVLADGFYEFTAAGDPKARRKDRWLFIWPGHPWFGIAGLCRADQHAGEAFTLLTCPPGPDLVPYHDRQVVLLSPAECFAWLDGAQPADHFVQTLPAGTLHVERA